MIRARVCFSGKKEKTEIIYTVNNMKNIRLITDTPIEEFCVFKLLLNNLNTHEKTATQETRKFARNSSKKRKAS